VLGFRTEVLLTVSHSDSLDPLVPTFTSILDKCDQCPYIKMRITVYYTRAKPESDNPEAVTRNGAGSIDISGPRHQLPFPGLQLKPGRPKLERILNSLCSRTEALRSPRGIAICVCGPVGLADEASKVARSIHAYRANSVGGIEVHEE
jgi:hypothetical protein